MARRKKIKVIERKLRRERAVGQFTFGDEIIEIDPRQRPRSYLNTLLHELLHAVAPDRSESWVCRGAGRMTEVLWRMGYRRVRL